MTITNIVLCLCLVITGIALTYFEAVSRKRRALQLKQQPVVGNTENPVQYLLEQAVMNESNTPAPQTAVPTFEAPNTVVQDQPVPQMELKRSDMINRCAKCGTASPIVGLSATTGLCIDCGTSIEEPKPAPAPTVKEESKPAETSYGVWIPANSVLIASLKEVGGGNWCVGQTQTPEKKKHSFRLSKQEAEASRNEYKTAYPDIDYTILEHTKQCNQTYDAHCCSPIQN